jgi:hypothetical protein
MEINIKLAVFCISLVLFLIPLSQVFAQHTELYLTVNKHNITVGEAVSGKVTVKLYASYGGTPSSCHTSIIFEGGHAPGSSPLSFDCSHDPSKTTENYTQCSKSFTHVYDTSGKKTLSASVSHYGLINQKRVTINVTKKTTPTAIDDLESPIEATTTAKIVERTIKIIYGLLTVLLVLIIMIGGFFYLTSAGDPQRISKGKQIIVYGIIGFGIMVISRGIIEFIFLILGIDNQITLF